VSNPRASTRARQATLLRLLREGVSAVEELAAKTGVSPSTVRRDLDRMRVEGQVARTYGGAIVTSPFQERSVVESARHGRAAKAAIARAALPLVPLEGRIFLDAGTTCAALAALLAARTPEGDAPGGGLTVVTRGLEIAVALADSGVAVELLGGRLRRMSHALVGPLASLALDRMAFDVAFLGADAVDPARGVGEPTVEETVVKEQVAARTARTVVLADTSKLAERTAPAWTVLEGGWTLVTDAVESPAGLAERCAAHQVELVLAPS
jgi:DeoR/GlpR family transcriptional regulator of sugar metabolism